ncbi:3'-5' exonuclease [Perlabentimonas gracilis]|uniref:3'-5' exonuclease n=1 Tax=Perlabentimonas gracilis TaxID=2715279 RepID=UPI00140D1FA9|nr:3'-5' exonuclease [Perlabentimonas gracilis]NHB68664.1 3'-5' exonuclease domain-containing protein 2 [Perlabentimonas gracilis]
MVFKDDITKEEVNQLPKAVYSGDIFVINSEDELLKQLPRLAKERIIGFDTETKPNFKKGQSNGIALLQLATPEIALLIKVKETGLPKDLVKILEDKSILKIGAAIRDDNRGLQKVGRFMPAGFIDLQSIVSEYGIESLSVRKMAAIVLGLKVSKSQQLSNWDAPAYTEAQQQYAAIDAWVCREIYIKLITNRVK